MNETPWYLNGRLHREDGPAIEYLTEIEYSIQDEDDLIQDKVNWIKEGF